MNNQQYITQFCENIRYLRQKHGLSQRKMAECMGIGICSLRAIEKGKIPARLDWLVVLRLHNVFHIPPDKVFLPLEFIAPNNVEVGQ